MNADGKTRPRWGRYASESLLTALLVLGLLGGQSACADPQAEQREAAYDLAVEAMAAGDHDAVLARVREIWDESDPDPRAAMLAAEASLEMAKAKDAIRYAEAGLNGGPDEALAADLNWARGTGYARRFHELGSEADWRVADTALESAAAAGQHRVQAAMLLAVMQVSGKHSNTTRFQRYAKLVLQLEPEGESADKVLRVATQFEIEL